MMRWFCSEWPECDFNRPFTEVGKEVVAEHEREEHGIFYTKRDSPFKDALKEEEEHGPVKFPPVSPREAILDEAKGYITKDRNSSYGEPEDNFANIARFWQAWLHHKLKPGETIDPFDVAEMMSLMKKGRMLTSPAHRDSHADDIGYSACAWNIVSKYHGVLEGEEVEDCERT